MEYRAGFRVRAGLVWAACLSAILCFVAPGVRADEAADLNASVHAGLECASCHGEPAAADKSGGAGPVDCAQCHPDPMQSLKGAPHGRALLRRFGATSAACTACHGKGHRILSARAAGSPVARANQPDTCGACHGTSDKVLTLPSRRTALESYRLTVHGQALAAGNTKAAACSDCHGAHDILPPGSRGSRVSRGAIAATCGACHRDEAAHFQASVHGRALAKGIREAPTCTDCHGEHTIRSPKEPGSSVWRGSVTRTCSGCHASERITTKFAIPADRLQTFLDSYHGLAGQSGDLHVANCASCHGWHDVLPASDPGSRVNPANLAATCGQCHPGAGPRLSAGKVHAALGGAGGSDNLADLFRRIYLFLIPLTLALLLAHNLADLGRKTLHSDELPPLKEEGDEPLLSAGERVQHAMLALSFFALSFSGFALKFPGLWRLAWFFRLGGEAARLSIHRAAAVAFVLLAVFHLGYLLFNAAGRRRLRALLPARRDLPDAVALFLFNVGLSPRRPLLARWSYIEKAEYWALAWGSAVMIVTGAVLVFHNLALSHFPLWVIEVCRVVHFMEAVLACLAILLWHGYWVVFDPEVYPMNWAWLTGRSRLRRRGSGKEGG